MAAWQLDLLLVPRLLAEKHASTDVTRIDAASVGVIDWWAETRLPPTYATTLSAFIPSATTWDAEWQIFGTTESNRVDVIKESNDVAEVRIRIDARDPDVQLFEHLCTFAEWADCVFLSGEGHIVRPTPEAIWVEVQLSAAGDFVSEPDAFFRKLNARRNNT